MFRILAIGKPDITGPTITSSASTSVQESVRLAFSITASELCTLAIGGADASKVELASNIAATSHTLRWLHDGIQDYESPADANADNVYSITVTGTDTSGNVGSPQSLAITVTDLATEDANWTNVVLLLGYEGSNGAAFSTISDESLQRHGSPSSGGTISSTQFKFGSTAASFLSLNGYYQDSDDWNLGTGNFTVETWVRPNTVATQQIIMGQWVGGLSGSGSDLGWVLFIDGTLLKWIVSTTGSNALLDLSGGTITANVWHHVAVDFDGTTYRLYLDGVKVASSTTLRTYRNSGQVLSIGGRADGTGNFLNGYLDDTRITKGVARYATNTSFTVPSAAFPRGGGAAWYDPWQVIFTVTTTANSSNMTGYNFRQVISGGSLSGSLSDVLRLKLAAASSSSCGIIECYIGEQANTGNVYDFKTTPVQLFLSGSASFSILAGQTVVTDGVSFHIDPTKTYVISARFSSGQFRTASLSGAAYYIGAFGVAETGSLAATSGYTETGGIGFVQDVQNYVGAFNLTVSPGLFVDTDAFYQPHRVTDDPLWNNVVFVTGYEGTNLSTVVTDESSSLHGAGTVSGAGTVVTAVKKYGASSFSFNGSTGVSWPDSADWSFGSGAFTVATWFRITAASGVQMLVGQWPNGTDLGWSLYTNGSALAFNISTSGNDNIGLLSGGTVSTGTFHHAQVDFDGTKYRLYLDGVMVASSTTLHTLNDSGGTLTLGANSSVNGMFLTGYLDETEILKGAARWGSNTSFTPPTAAYLRS